MLFQKMNMWNVTNKAAFCRNILPAGDLVHSITYCFKTKTSFLRVSSLPFSCRLSMHLTALPVFVVFSTAITTSEKAPLQINGVYRKLEALKNLSLKYFLKMERY